MDNALPSFLTANEPRNFACGKLKQVKLPFIDRTLKKIAEFIVTSYHQGYTAQQTGFLQKISSWAKMVFLLGFIVVVTLTTNPKQQILYSVFLILLFIISRIPVYSVYKRIFFISFVFGFIIILPASLNVITPGRLIVTFFTFQSEPVFWIYTLPKTIGISAEGLTFVLKFWHKVANSLALTLLIAYTTQFADMIKSLKILKVPDVLLLTITLTHKYLFILAQTTEEAYFALKARWWKKQKSAESTNIVAGRIMYIFRRSWIKYEEIYMAMIARGYTGTVKLVYNSKVKVMDILFLLMATFIAIAGFYF